MGLGKDCGFHKIQNKGGNLKELLKDEVCSKNFGRCNIKLASFHNAKKSILILVKILEKTQHSLAIQIETSQSSLSSKDDLKEDSLLEGIVQYY